jgi:hypothetical protein
LDLSLSGVGMKLKPAPIDDYIDMSKLDDEKYGYEDDAYDDDNFDA